ncbi:MAG: hypothetical protein QW222_01510 [Candidatus Bathyarchaeia archaeon]
MKKKFSYVLCILALFATAHLAFPAMLQNAYLSLYWDGLAHFKAYINAEESEASITLPLLANRNQIYNVLALDENSSPLSYDLEEWNLTVHSLGATTITIEYDVEKLTNLEEGVWTLTLSAPFEITVILPENTTVLYINESPLSSTTQQGRVHLNLSPGHWEISYAESQNQQGGQADMRLYLIIIAAALAVTALILALYTRQKRKLK